MIHQQWIAYVFCCFLLLLLLVNPCRALSSTSITKSIEFPTVNLQSTGTSQLAILDGGEWSTVQALLQKEGRIHKRTFTKYGYMTIVTGRNDENQRVIAMQTLDDENNTVYQDSVAFIPDQVSEMDAIATYISSLSAIHCALPPKLKGIGGGTDSAQIVQGKTVVLGSNELACFAAEGLATLGVQVSLVSPGSPNVKKNVGTLNVLKPAVGSEEIGFSSHVGEFDSLVDTINNEMRFNNPIMDDDDEYHDFIMGGSTLGLLKSQHNCHRYISTLTECQKIVAKEGIFGGPGKADAYAKQAGRPGFVENNPDFAPIPPPEDIGTSITTLLGKGVIFSQQARKKLYDKSDVVRGWSLADFWENTRWPRDSSVSSDVRFGLPVTGVDDIEEDDPMLAEAPSRSFERIAVRKLLQNDDDDDNAEAPQLEQNNPHVYQINGVSGMQSNIMEPEKDCILFLSARFCKTCKSLNQKFTRLARIEKENDSPVFFARAEMGTSWGKKLGRALEVDVVPSFVLFRKGKRFGSSLSVNDLPSKKIGRALELLESGKDWDPMILKEE